MRRDSESRPRANRYPTRERLLRYLVELGVITPRSREADAIRVIAALPPRCLRVPVVAAVLSMSQRTLWRLFRNAGLPSARGWIGLVRALWTHYAILRGRPLKDAAGTGGYPDPFTMSNAIHRTTGFRPSALRGVGWTQLVDAWIAHQRRRGTLQPPADPSSESPSSPDSASEKSEG